MLSWFKSKTIIFGSLLAFAPQVLDYMAKVDWASWGLSPNTATLIGAIVIALRAVTTQPLSEK